MIFWTKKKKKFKLRILAENKGAHANFFVENTQKIGEIQPGADKEAINQLTTGTLSIWSSR